MSEKLTVDRAARMRRIARMPLVSPRQWLRRFIFWVGAIGVSVIAIAFAAAADKAAASFQTVVGPHPYAALAIAPAGLVVCFLLTRHVFPGAQGSGIPQTIAAIHLIDQTVVARVLSLRIAV